MTHFPADADHPMLSEDPAAFAPLASGPSLNMGTELPPLERRTELEELFDQLQNVEEEQLPMEMPMPGDAERVSLGHEQLLSAVADQPIQLPIQIRLDGAGNVEVCKNVAFCHQPPWKQGCAAGVGEFRGGADKDKRRYCYECSCGSKWNQTRPEFLSPGEDPQIALSYRATKLTDKRRCDGYNCKKCGGKKNIEFAQLNGLTPCTCDKTSTESTDKSAADTSTDLELEPLTAQPEQDSHEAAREAVRKAMICMRGGGTQVVATSTKKVVSVVRAAAAAPVVAKKVSFDVDGKQPERSSVVKERRPPPPSAGTRARATSGGIRIGVSEITDQGDIVTQDYSPTMMKKRKERTKEILCFRCKCVLDNDRGRTVVTSIGCGKTKCPHWACYVCSGFTEQDIRDDKAEWFCGCKAQKHRM